MPVLRHTRERWIELSTQATAAFYRHKYDEAEKCLKQALSLAHHQGPHVIASMLENLAEVYIDIDRYDAATLALEKAFDVLDNIPPHRDTASLLSLLGLRYTQMGRHEEALRIEKKRQAIVRQLVEPDDVIDRLFRETEEEMERIRQDKREHDLLIEELKVLLGAIPIEIPNIQDEAARAAADSEATAEPAPS